ncbi:NCS2 family permease [Acetivibrio cellulolyticus]|uniref:NCS2 family permease n=1 Tax=Acetivibrio cellulolyticus TaxID=35830 RepID=UPI0001E30581|nr:NCS2 family permease [Acetivibrio cellulolyticus]
MEKLFKLKDHGTTVKMEFVAGLTTFVTMAYVIFVNPSVLGGTGMDTGAVFVATILAAVIGTLVMGLYANVPYAQAPGMGLNAFFTYTVCGALGFNWRQALAIVFICGVINIIITATRIRKMLIDAIPETLQYAISGGIGLFIAYIGIKQAHFLNFTSESQNITATLPGGSVVAKDVVPAIVNFTDPVSQLALIGLVITVVLMLKNVKGAILLGIISTTVLGLFIGNVTPRPDLSLANFIPPSITPTLFKLDLVGLFSDPSKIFIVLSTVLAFSLSDTFDTIGTFLGTGRKTGIFDEKDEAELHKSKGIKSKMDKALFADAIATSLGSLLGTSNTTTYVESAAGISAGGRTGLTSVFTAMFFLLALVLAPFAGMVTSAATAPALIVVGVLMMESITKVKWEEFEEAAAAFFTAVIMPFTYSISNGVAAGFLFYIISKVARGKAKEVHPLLYIVTLLFVADFVFRAF